MDWTRPPFERAGDADTSAPQKVADTMAFIFETKTKLCATSHALASLQLQGGNDDCRCGPGKRFRPAP